MLLLVGVIIFLIFSWAIRPWRTPVAAEESQTAGYGSKFEDKLLNILKGQMRFFITCALLVGGLYVILSTYYTPDDKNWAYGTIGTLLGYWLRPTQ
jgi:hypothetical protein